MTASPMEIVKIVAPLVTAIGIAFVTTWISIKVKFAPTAAHAMKEAKAILLVVVAVILNLGVAAQLVLEILLPNPNLRISLLYIIFYSFVLFNSYISFVFMRLLRLIGRLVTIAEVLTESN